MNAVEKMEHKYLVGFPKFKKLYDMPKTELVSILKSICEPYIDFDFERSEVFKTSKDDTW